MLPPLITKEISFTCKIYKHISIYQFAVPIQPLTANFFPLLPFFACFYSYREYKKVTTLLWLCRSDVVLMAKISDLLIIQAYVTVGTVWAGEGRKKSVEHYTQKVSGRDGH